MPVFFSDYIAMNSNHRFLRLHDCNSFLADYSQPQNGILSSFLVAKSLNKLSVLHQHAGEISKRLNNRQPTRLSWYGAITFRMENLAARSADGRREFQKSHSLNLPRSIRRNLIDISTCKQQQFLQPLSFISQMRNEIRWSYIKEKFAVRNACSGSNYQASYSPGRGRQAVTRNTLTSLILARRFPLFSYNDKNTRVPRARFPKPTLACTIEKLCKLRLLSSADTHSAKKVKTIFSCSSWDTNYDVLQHELRPAMEIFERTKRNFVRVRKNFLSRSEI